MSHCQWLLGLNEIKPEESKTQESTQGVFPKDEIKNEINEIKNGKRKLTEKI